MHFSQILIIDSSLITTEGHHFEYAKSVYDAARKRGIDVRVACHRDVVESVREKLDVLPVFRQRIYDAVVKFERFPKIKDWINGVAYAFAFLLDWRKANITKCITPGTLIFLPTCTPAMALALGLLLRFRRKMPHTLAICLFRSDPKPVMSLVDRLLRPLLEKQMLLLATDSDLLAAEYQKKTNLAFTVLPIPHTTNTFGGLMHTTRRHGAVQIAYLGDARLEKGVDILAEAICYLDPEIKGKKIRLLIQCSVVIPEPQVIEVVRRLKVTASMYNDGISLLHEGLSSSDYYRLLLESDIIVLPYRKSRYLYRTSGILVEAFTAGKPVIVTEGTWMCKQIEKYGAGVWFKDGDAEDLGRVIKKAAAKIGELTEKAQRVSVEWREMHNPRKFLDVILYPVWD